MRLIGIAGAGHSGKTTFGGLLAAELSDQGHVVRLDAFATPIKRQLRHGDAYFDKERHRRPMQDLGSVHRAVDPDYYLKAMAIRLARDHCDYVILPDVRFPNEGRYVRRSGVLFFLEGMRKPLPATAAAHESESHFLELMGMADVVLKPQRSLEAASEFIRRLVRCGGHNKS
jgi:hypothetical protein